MRNTDEICQIFSLLRHHFQDQLKRYNEIKHSDLPSAVAAKKTREFRCPPVEQMKLILGFKNLEVDDEDNKPCGDSLITQLTEMHQSLMEKISLEGLVDEEGGEVRLICAVLSSNEFFLNISVQIYRKKLHLEESSEWSQKS